MNVHEFPQTTASAQPIAAAARRSAEPPEPLIALTGVSKRYGVLEAVGDVNLQIAPGEIFGLIGHNGAGKSTLFKLMMGLLAPTTGRITVAGVDVQGPGFRAVRCRLGYLPENVVLWDNLTGRETLEFFARLKGVNLNAEPVQALLAQVGLAHAGVRPVRAYSKGMRQRLAFAQALLGQPQLLLLDEPTNGLDPQAIHDFHDVLQRLRSEGVTVVISTHILSELQTRVDRLAMMVSGQVQAVGSVAALREQCPLPLRLTVRWQAMAPSAAVDRVRTQVQAVLSAVASRAEGAVTLRGAPDAAGEAGAVWHLTCPRSAKLAVLQTLSAAPEVVADLDVQEPSLEAIFLGWSQAPASLGASGGRP